MFLRSESESDQRHQNADDRNERRSDIQPFAARDALAAHNVWPDVVNRQQD